MRQLLVIFGSLVAASGCFAAEADYFPLQVGNRWVLQTKSADPEILNIEVLRSRHLDGKTYFLVSGYTPDQRWLRRTEAGGLVALDETSGAELTLAELMPGRAGYRTSLGMCPQTAVLGREAASFNGTWVASDRALAVQYWPDLCADIGFTQEVYGAGVGLLRRTLTTFIGEKVFELISGQVGGVPVVGRSKEVVLDYRFRDGSKGWLSGFSDYSLKNSDLRMVAEIRALPDEIDQQRTGYYLQSTNRSDDLFMFLKKEVTGEQGLEPNQAYLVSFDIRFASNTPTGCAGIGGSPGDSVYLKAGASADEPIAVLSGGTSIRISIDKGEQAAGGKDAGMAGTIANGTPCEGVDWPYVRVRKTYAHPSTVKTDSRGTLWLIIGTDSGFEGFTGVYIESITVSINPAMEAAAN